MGAGRREPDEQLFQNGAGRHHDPQRVSRPARPRRPFYGRREFRGRTAQHVRRTCGTDVDQGYGAAAPIRRAAPASGHCMPASRGHSGESFASRQALVEPLYWP